MSKIDTYFKDFAEGSATVLSEKKNWSKIKRMSKDKNADVWQQVWTKTARPAAIKSLKAAGLGLSDKEIAALADEYGQSRRPEFIRLTTKTDINRLKQLVTTPSKEDLEERIKNAGISRASRKALMEAEEVGRASKELLLMGYREAGYQTKTWSAKGAKACEKCVSMSGETVAINRPYSNGSMIAHAHPHCQCRDEYDSHQEVKGGRRI